MRADLPDRVIVTGGASGIGEAVVRAFADNGATVGIINRSADSIERALKGGLADYVDRIHWRVADVADEAAVRTATDGPRRGAGRPRRRGSECGGRGRDGGGGDRGNQRRFRRVLEVNVLGVFHLVKAAVPHLTATRHPSVTIVGSDSGFVAVRDARVQRVQGCARAAHASPFRSSSSTVIRSG